MGNIGTYDALLRIGTGALALAWASSRSRWSGITSLVATCGAVLVGEGITRFSPLYAVMSLTTVEDEGDKVILRVGPVTYRRRPHSSRAGCTLWGVTQDDDPADESPELSSLSANKTDWHSPRRWEPT
jgi:hypothetical protein